MQNHGYRGGSGNGKAREKSKVTDMAAANSAGNVVMFRNKEEKRTQRCNW